MELDVNKTTLGKKEEKNFLTYVPVAVTRAHILSKLKPQEKNRLKETDLWGNGLITHNTLIAGNSADFDKACVVMGQKKLKNITELDLQFVPSAEQLKKFSKLTSFAVGPNVNDTMAQTLADRLKIFKDLKSLTIHGSFENEGVQALAESLKDKKNLQSVSIKGVFKNASVEAIAEALKDKINLQLLNITSNGWFENAGAQALAEALKDKKNLQSIVIKGWFENAGAQALAEALKDKKNLESVIIQGDFENVGAQALADMLETLPNLQFLQINIKNDADAQVIAKALKNETRLQSVVMQGEFKNAGAQAFVEALKDKKNLQSLIISGWFDKTEVISFAKKTLEKHPTLTTLRINDEKINLGKKIGVNKSEKAASVPMM